eukprot:450350_1
MIKRLAQKIGIQNNKVTYSNVNVTHDKYHDIDYHSKEIIRHYCGLHSKSLIVVLIISLQLFASILLIRWTRLKYSFPHHTDVRLFHSSQYRTFMTLYHKQYIFESLLNSFVDLTKSYNISYYITQGGLL